MKRRWFAVVGASLLLGETVVFVAFGFPPLDIQTAFSLALPAVCGVLFVLGGFSAGGEYIEWNRFVGSGDVLIGISVGVSVWRSVASDPTLGSEATTFFTAVSVIGGLSMVFIGLRWFRGSDDFGTGRYEPGPLFGSGDRTES